MVRTTNEPGSRLGSGLVISGDASTRGVGASVRSGNRKPKSMHRYGLSPTYPKRLAETAASSTATKPSHRYGLRSALSRFGGCTIIIALNWAYDICRRLCPTRSARAARRHAAATVPRFRSNQTVASLRLLLYISASSRRTRLRRSGRGGAQQMNAVALDGLPLGECTSGPRAVDHSRRRRGQVHLPYVPPPVGLRPRGRRTAEGRGAVGGHRRPGGRPRPRPRAAPAARTGRTQRLPVRARRIFLEPASAGIGLT